MRKRSISVLAAVVCACLGWVAAPALSLRPYVPEAVDFEQPLPPLDRATSRAASAIDDHRHAGAAGDPGHHPPPLISPPIEAPHRFDLVGIAGEMRPVSFRVRDGEESWSEWVETHSGDPVYVGGADQVQVAASFPPRGELHYVNVSGTAGGIGDRLLNSARQAINSAFISVASAPLAEALAKKPKMVGRAGWGATRVEGGCQPRGPAQYGEVRTAVVHHTVNANDYGKEEAAGIVLGICRFHVFANGWNDIGYNALVDRFGRLYKGRAGGLRRAVVGAQAQGFNSQTTSIASLGTHTTKKLGRKAKGSVIRYLAWKLGLHGATPVTGKTRLTSAGGSASRYPAGTVINAYRVHGHKRVGLTECPGAALARQIAGIRRHTQARIKRFHAGGTGGV
jgi:hypothetical protein